MILLTGSANPSLAHALATRLRVPLAACLLDRFPDGELHVEIRESVRGQTVFLLQPTSPPVETHLFELLLLADACRRAGAGRVVAVIPYFGYARQDRRAAGRDAIAARLASDLVAAAGIHEVVVLDLHSRAAEGFFSVPAEHLTAVPQLAGAIRSSVDRATGVLVAPDLGAVKLADYYSRLLDLPVATVHKLRISGRDVKVQQLVGDVRDRVPVIVDDMISTGGTVAAAVRALLAAGARPDVTVVATHGVFADQAIERLRDVPVGRIVTTDSVAPHSGLPLPIEVVPIAPMLADVIARIDQHRSLGALVSHQ
jgi:ribose-phosphate pyrophosphokinase